MNKHTPGPWEVLEAEDARYITTDHGDQYIAKTVDLLDEPANATLMAAAPELLDAIVNMVSRFDIGKSNYGFVTDSDLRKCHAAIAKARGQS